MQRIDGVPNEHKVKQIARVTKCYGFCCNQTNDFKKSLEIHNKAIRMLEDTFGQHNATRMKLLGYCHSNRGTAFEELRDLESAKQSYNVAIDIYYDAYDWISVEEMNSSLYLARKKLDHLTKKVN